MKIATIVIYSIIIALLIAWIIGKSILLFKAKRKPKTYDSSNLVIRADTHLSIVFPAGLLVATAIWLAINLYVNNLVLLIASTCFEILLFCGCCYIGFVKIKVTKNTLICYRFFIKIKEISFDNIVYVRSVIDKGVCHNTLYGKDDKKLFGFTTYKEGIDPLMQMFEGYGIKINYTWYK